MLTSLLHEVRFWPHLWRRRLSDSWRFRRHEHLGFVLVLALVVTAVAGVIYVAYRDGTSIEPVRMETVQRDEARARQRDDDLQCLAENVYFEARGEPLAGQFAVAEVTLNRTHARNFPRTICAVVHETRWDPVRRRHTADFSWTELGALTPEDGAAWKQAMKVANATYDELSPSLVPEALYYHATSVRPDWARSRRTVATIGNHIFYR